MIRVIGLGSPFGDDRAGWDLVAALRDRVPAAVDLVALDRPGAALINWIEGVDWLVLVDACLAGDQVGRFHRIDPSALQTPGPAWNSHALDLHEVLALARQLGLAPPRLDIYAIAIDAPGSGGRSSAVSAAVQALAQRLATELAQACRQAPADGAQARPGLTAQTIGSGKNSLH